MSKKSIHVAMARLYEGARSACNRDQPHTPTELAGELEVTPQEVNNWERRGPSKNALLVSQLKLGINASWVEHHVGPMLIPGQWTTPRTALNVVASANDRTSESHSYPWPFDNQPTALQYFEMLTVEDRESIHDFVRWVADRRLRTLRNSNAAR